MLSKLNEFHKMPSIKLFKIPRTNKYGVTGTDGRSAARLLDFPLVKFDSYEDFSLKMQALLIEEQWIENPKIVEHLSAAHIDFIHTGIPFKRRAKMIFKALGRRATKEERRLIKEEKEYYEKVKMLRKNLIKMGKENG